MNGRIGVWVFVVTGVAAGLQALGNPHQRLAQGQRLARPGTAPQAVKVYEDLIGDEAVPERYKISASWLLAHTHANILRSPDNARKAIQRGLALDLAQGMPADVDRLHVFPAKILITERKYDEAIATAKSAIQKGLKCDSGKLMAAQCMAEALMRQRKHAEASAILEKALAEFPEAGANDIMQARCLLAAACRWAGKDEVAVNAGLAALSQRISSPAVLNRLRREWLPILKKEGNGKLAVAAVKRLREILPATARDPKFCELVQTMIVEILSARGLHDEVILEGKLLMDVSSGQKQTDAMATLASTLKRVDGNMVRANAVLEYARVGCVGADGVQGTADDIPAPLADLKRPPHPERDKAFEDALANAKPGWQGSLTKATLYRYWGKPRLALAELNAAFADCPMQAEPIQTVVDGIVRVLFQASGNPATGTQFAAFQQFGPNGPDRQKGTADDLTNPVLDYLPK